MSSKLIGAICLGAALATIALFNSRPAVFSQTSKSSLSSAEQELLTEINLARANPQVYAGYLEATKPLFKGKEYRPVGRHAIVTEEGWAAVDDAIKFLRSAKPQSPLTLSNGLCLAATSHVSKQSKNGEVGHQSDSGSITERVKTFGTWDGKIAENLSYGNESARDRVLDWLMDDGTPNRGHRNALMSENFKVAGICCRPHPGYGSMCALTLAGGFTDLSAQSNQKSTTTNSNANTSSGNTKIKGSSTTSNSNKTGATPTPRKY